MTSPGIRENFVVRPRSSPDIAGLARLILFICIEIPGKLRKRKSPLNSAVFGCAAGSTVYFGRMMLFIATLVSACGLCFAEEEVKQVTNRTVVTSETMTYDYQRNIAEFKGSVKAVDQNVEIRSDILRIFFRNRENIKAVTALGNVQVFGQNRTAKCDKAVYFVSKGEIILMGNAEVSEGESQLAAEEITFWVDDDRMLAKRAHLRIEGRNSGDGNGAEKDGALPEAGEGEAEDSSEGVEN